MKGSSKITICSLLLFIAIALMSFSSTYAYFSDNADVAGNTTLGTLVIDLKDGADSVSVLSTVNNLVPGGYLAGDETNFKHFTIDTSKANIDSYVRVKVEANLEISNIAYYSIFDISLGDGWYLYRDGFYYQVADANPTSNSVAQKVLATTNEVNLDVKIQLKTTVKGDDYMNKSGTYTITVQTIQSSYLESEQADNPYTVAELSTIWYNNIYGEEEIFIIEDNVVVGLTEYGATLSYLMVPEGVTSLADGVFGGNDNLQNIYLPETLTTIGSYAFGETNLASITIPASVTTIGDGAFAYCYNLKSITVEEGNTIYTDGDCNAIIQVANNEVIPDEGYDFAMGTVLLRGCASTIIPNNVSAIYWQAFSGSAITSISIPASVIEICGYAFDYCEHLKTITFAEGSQLQYIGEYAFEGCVNLTSITIPSSVTTISSNTFSRCTGLTSAIFENPLLWYYNVDTDTTTGTQILSNELKNITTAKTYLTSTYVDKYWYRLEYNLPDDWLSWDETTSSYQVIKGSSSLPTELVIPAVYNDGTNGEANVTSIQDGYIDEREGIYTVFDSQNLTIVVIPKTMIKIGNYAFYSCSNLTNVIFAENSQLTTIGHNAFNGCTGLTNITMPNSVTTIGYSAFNGCTNLTNVIFAENSQLTTINNRAFDGCTSLTSITIPSSITTIGNYAFYNCTSLTSIVVEEENTTYDSRNNCNAIIETETNTLVVGCKTTIIPDSVTAIGDYAFYGCTGLASITIPSSVTTIGNYAFYNCTSLTSITFEDDSQLTTIDNNAFYGCTGLTNITIPSSVTTIGNSAFERCTSLTNIVVEEGNTIYDSRNNCNAIIETATNTLVVGCKTTTVPNTVTTIGNNAFYVCTGLTSITIPSGVTTIESSAFDGCTGLTSISFEGNSQLVTIGNFAFRGCANLTSITIPLGVTTIGEYAFNSCASLTSITFDENSQLTTIGNAVFNSCTSLTSITIPSSVTTIGVNAFNGCTSLTSVIFAENSQLTTIENYAFRNCASLTSITIPSSVITIGNSAFAGCIGLASVIFAENSQLTTIGNYAFRGCANLTSIIIPANVTRIGYFVFNGCTNLTSITFEDTSNWYRTSSSSYTNGTSVDVSNATQNATWLVSTSGYYNYYWYKK